MGATSSALAFGAGLAFGCGFGFDFALDVSGADGTIGTYFIDLFYLHGWRPLEHWEVTPIIGASKESHIGDAVAALDVTLSAEEIARLEAPYVPHRVTGMG